MTFDDITDEVIQARFKSNQSTSAQRWINMRYAQIWSYADWPWRNVSPTSLAVVANDNTPAIPADVDTVLGIYDDNGSPLQYMIEKDFDAAFRYSQIQGGSGRPASFKWSNGVLTLGLTPDAAYTFSISYYRKLAHINNLGTVVSGKLDVASDEPIWDPEWHYILVLGAISTGLKIENDPTWQPLEQEFGLMLAGMVEEYLPSDATVENMQYGSEYLRP